MQILARFAAPILGMAIVSWPVTGSADDQMGAALSRCTNGAWPAARAPKSDSDWEAVIRAGWQTSEFCKNLIGGSFSVYVRMTYPQEPDQQRHWEDTFRRALGGS